MLDWHVTLHLNYTIKSSFFNGQLSKAGMQYNYTNYDDYYYSY